MSVAAPLSSRYCWRFWLQSRAGAAHLVPRRDGADRLDVAGVRTLPLSYLDQPPRDEGIKAQLGVADNNTTGRFTAIFRSSRRRLGMAMSLRAFANSPQRYSAHRPTRGVAAHRYWPARRGSRDAVQYRGYR
jgi:hypothetical protein